MRSTREAARLAEILADDYWSGRLGRSMPGPATQAVWETMPEVRAVEDLSGEPGYRVRLFLTFVCAVDRMRNADRLWRDAARLFEAHPEVFWPEHVIRTPRADLKATLSRHRVSKFHGPDTEGWLRIAHSLATGAGPVCDVIRQGRGDAAAILRDLRRGDQDGNRFPLLRGKKIGPMWLRIMVAPGGAAVSRMEVVPIAVDVQVRKATAALGVAYATDLPTSTIQDAWREAVAAGDVPGPPGLAGTCAALDPALWSLGRSGCSRCHKKKLRVPISRACDSCVLPFPARREKRSAEGMGSRAAGEESAEDFTGGATMTILDRAERAMREAGRPLGLSELARRMSANGWTTKAFDPPGNVGTSLADDVKTRTSRFRRVGPGVYALKRARRRIPFIR